MSSNNLQFSIAGHKLKVVAIDGFYIEEQEVDYISIHAGERYDFILVADQGVKKYQIWQLDIITQILEIIILILSYTMMEQEHQ